MYQQRQQMGVNPLNGLNALKMYSNYQNGTGLMGLFNSGAAGGAAGGSGTAGIASSAGGATGAAGASGGMGATGATGATGAGGMAGMGGLGTLGMFALPAYIVGGLAASGADPETFGKLPLVGTTGEALNSLFNGNGFGEFFDTDNIAQNLLPGIGDFFPDETSDQIFQPVSDFFGNIFGF